MNETRVWEERAACPDKQWLFDHTISYPNDEQATSEAKAVCAKCPALKTCLAEILRVEAGEPLRERHGVVAGLTPLERLNIESPVPPINNHGTTAGYWAHRRRREPACYDCMDAHKDKERELEHARRARNKSDTARATIGGARISGRRAS